MSENVMYALMFGWIPLLFIGVGVAIVIQGGKQLYHSQFASVKVMARCIDVQQIQEEGRILYRPVYEYMYNGQTIRGTKLDYEDVKYTDVSNMSTIMDTIYVDKKHPDIVVDAPGSAAPAIVKLVMGLIFTFTALQFVGPVLLMLFLDQLR